MNPKTIISLLAIPLAILLLLAAPTALEAQFNCTLNADNTYTIERYVGTGGAVTIPPSIAGRSVTIIGEAAFADIGSVTSVTIPGSVTSIGYEAFDFCYGLTSVTIGNGVTSIGEEAFSDCHGLTSVTIPGSVTSIGENAFEWGYGLTSVTIANGVISIGASAFGECTNLTSITIPGSVTSFGGAFSDCSGLTSVTIGNGVTGIGDYAFSGCSRLASVTIPGSVTSIGKSSFYGCYGVSSTGAYGLTSITIPSSVTRIGAHAFDYCFGLSNVYFQGNAPTADSSVFEYDTYATVYNSPGTTGWSSTFAGRPAVLLAGSLKVTITPAGAINAGAQWQVDGGPWQKSGATVGNLSVGNHTVSFKTVSGWVTPGNQIVSVSTNSTTKASGTYLVQTGFLQVSISPLAAILAGAQWRMDGGTWQNSGVDIVSVGNHTVNFNTISGWTTPANQTVLVSANSITTASGIYVAVPPSITTQPANESPALGGIATFSVKANGTPLTYQWIFDGAPLSDIGNISGSASKQLTVNLVASNNVGSYSVVVANSFVSVTSKVVQLTLTRETSKPSVAIASPKANSRTNAPVLSGTASDSVRVLNVAYWLTNVNNGVKTTVNGIAALAAGTGSSSNWTIQRPLLPGTNILAVQSSNYAGLASPVESSTFFYQVRTPLQLQINPAGMGTVTGIASVNGDAHPTNGAALYVGEGYTLTANPAMNWWLTNWLTNGGIAGTNTTLAFIMESNLVVTANFATNLFVGMAARYDGIFYPSSPQPATETNSGLVYNLVLGTNGVYSGKMYLASGTPYTLAGAFDRSGQATETIGRGVTAGGNVTLQLNIPWQSVPRQITGLVRGTNAGGWISTNLNLYAAATNTNNFPAYTVLLPQDTNVPGSPPNYGYALITNMASMIYVGGALSDGTSFSSFVEPINAQDEFPVYASLYNNTGLLLGQLSLDVASNATVPTGSLIWFKPSEHTGLYSNGVTASLDVEGSPWTNSAAALAGLFPDDAQLTFSGGGLASNLVSIVQLTSSNTFRRVSGSTDFASGTINRTNGLMTLSFTNTSGKKVTASGTLLQNTGTGGGFFLGATNAGSILLQP